MWSKAEQALHINVLKLKATNFCISTFCRYEGDGSSSCANEQPSSIGIFIKNKLNKRLRKKIWKFCMADRITLLQNIYWGL